MISSFRRNIVKLALTGALVVALPSVTAGADCLRPGHGVDMTLVQAEPHAETNVSMSDPALDGLFDRYADLHRDAVGYVVADVTSSSMVAKAATPEPRISLTR